MINRQPGSISRPWGILNANEYSRAIAALHEGGSRNDSRGSPCGELTCTSEIDCAENVSAQSAAGRADVASFCP